MGDVGGNPFFALELARALERRGGRIEPSAALPVPATLEDLVQARLETLTPEAEEACRVVVAQPHATVRVVALACGGEAGIEAALRARVLELDGERLRFTHPLLASAIEARQALEALSRPLELDRPEQQVDGRRRRGARPPSRPRRGAARRLGPSSSDEQR